MTDEELIKAQSAEIERQHGICRIKPEPVKEVRWCNDYENAPAAKWHRSRDIADLCSLPARDSAPLPARIAVIRREIVDGVVSYYKEDV